MNKFKYLAAFTVPVLTCWMLFSEGWWTFISLMFYFCVIPLFELVLPTLKENLTEAERLKQKNDPWFDVLLYVMVPVQLALIVLFLFQIQTEINTVTLVGKIIAMGIMNGVIAINVGHELGHRRKQFEVILGEILLASSLESHFLPYHNRGHHANVATPKDPATARRNEPLYFFLDPFPLWKLF
jgi:alkane 1-monooxygenase